MNLLKEEFLEFVQRPDFPCIGAKAAAKRDCITILIAADINSAVDDSKILAMLYEFIDHWKKDKNYLQTACIIFNKSLDVSEVQFEALLWNRLQKLHELDAKMFTWDETVSSNISDPKFSFSIGGQGFFVVGLHSNSSRKARRFPYPTLVFNLHAQFEAIRDNGIFEKMKDKIREADCVYSGSVNPMVNDFGEMTEALQYSGREVSAESLCPFTKKSFLDDHWKLIPPCSGESFVLKKDEFLVVEDPLGEQVSDLFCFSLENKDEFLSSGKSIDYNNTLKFTTSNQLFSNKSNLMLSIINDEVGVHDFLFAPCDKNTFKIIYNDQNSTGCYEHLVKAFEPYAINPQYIITTFNIFMNVAIDGKTGQLDIKPPLSKKGNKIIFRSHMNLIVGLTACSAPKSNNGSLKPIRFKVI